MTSEQLTELLQDFFAYMGLTITPDVTQDDQLFIVDLQGSDVRYIEKSRDNRAGAFITILKLIIKQRYDDDSKIVLDFNGQRKQRLINVAQMAKKMAERVRVSGVEEELPPMTPAERRAIHMEIKEMSGVKTESKGEEPHRRIIIVADDSE